MDPTAAHQRHTIYIQNPDNMYVSSQCVQHADHMIHSHCSNMVELIPSNQKRSADNF